MRTHRTAAALLLALTLIGAGNLAAQRRGTGGGGATAGRPAPGGRGGSSVGATRGRASSGGRRAAMPSRGATGQAKGRASGTRDRGTETRGSARVREPQGSGKIGAIRDRARAARIRTSRGVILVPGVWLGRCWNCSYWGWYRGYWGWYGGGFWYPGYYPRYHRPPEDYEHYEDYEEERPALGQGYLAYPYAGGDRGDTFVRSRVPDRRRFGALTAQYFEDRGSTTQAGRVALEGAVGVFRGEVAYGHYAEPLAGSTDRLHTWRAAVGVQPRLGRYGYLVVGGGVRGVVLRGGSDASGPEGELGLQIFPRRPVGANVTGRIARLSWSGFDAFTFRELNASGSVFFGRIELQAGWHWMQVGRTPAFRGPVAGARLWF
ncbi:MAG: hypothetical protein HY705_09895 [Gemmatimonadetes bacterium]|nr:hypothetical protein [Gemmatimonadota bacterium]